jgi:hypothetical protein
VEWDLRRVCGEQARPFRPAHGVGLVDEGHGYLL